MKWRCGWCGKPQERNDPPCDNCGHHAFEKAVVPLAPESGTGPTVWVCESCGRSHPRNRPPCSRCGHTKLKKEVQSREDDFDTEPETEPWTDPESGGGDSETGAEITVWACTECNRTHPRNNPPCSGCGSMTFERRVQEFDDLLPSGGGWIDALDAKYALGFLGAFLFLGLILASSFGLLGIGGPPAVEDVPGSDTTASGLVLADVEDAYVTELNEQRVGSGQSSLDRNDRLDAIATYTNRRVVKATYGEGSMPSDQEIEDASEHFEACTYYVRYAEFQFDFTDRPENSLADFSSETALASALVDEYVVRYGYMEETNGLVGVDVHVGPDGRVFVTQFVC